MATLELTPPATHTRDYLQTLDLARAQDRLEHQLVQQRMLDESVHFTRERVQALTPKPEPIPEVPAPVRYEFSIDELLHKDYYYYDGVTNESSELDDERMEGQRNREAAFRAQRDRVETRQSSLDTLTRLPNRIEAAKKDAETAAGETKKLDDSRSSTLTFGLWNSKARAAEVEKQNSALLLQKRLEAELPDREKNMESVGAELEIERATLAEMKRTTPDGFYRVDDLHALPAVGFSDRTAQKVLVDFDGGSEFTFRIPRTPQEKDFPRTFSLEIDDRDELGAFVELLGSKFDLQNGHWNVGDAVMEYNDSFYDELIPFPLEVVMINGHEEFRIPQSVWNRFSQYFQFVDGK